MIRFLALYIVFFGFQHLRAHNRYYFVIIFSFKIFYPGAQIVNITAKFWNFVPEDEGHIIVLCLCTNLDGLNFEIIYDQIPTEIMLETISGKSEYFNCPKAFLIKFFNVFQRLSSIMNSSPESAVNIHHCRG